jgi:hypothetical protein
VARDPPSVLLRRRLVSQGLAGPTLGTGADGPVAVARRLLATQAQDPRGARLAIRARTRATTAADVDRALSDERSLVVTWLNRGTLHLVAREDYPLLQALTAPPLQTTVAASVRRLTGSLVSSLPFEPLADSVSEALEREAAAVVRFLSW